MYFSDKYSKVPVFTVENAVNATIYTMIRTTFGRKM